LHEAGELTQDVSIEPQSEECLTNYQRNTDDRHRLVSQGEVDEYQKYQGLEVCPVKNKRLKGGLQFKSRHGQETEIVSSEGRVGKRRQ